MEYQKYRFLFLTFHHSTELHPLGHMDSVPSFLQCICDIESCLICTVEKNLTDLIEICSMFQLYFHLRLDKLRSRKNAKAEFCLLSKNTTFQSRAKSNYKVGKKLQSMASLVKLQNIWKIKFRLSLYLDGI